jgi:hypothetical protein
MALKQCTIAASVLLAVSGTFCFAQGAAGAQPGGKDSPGQNIKQEHQAAMEKCNALKDNAKDICKAEADGRRKIAEAELKAQQNNTPKNQLELAETKAKAEYEVAKQKCDDEVGDKKNACQKGARAARDQALAQAKMQSQSSATGSSSAGDQQQSK